MAQSSKAPSKGGLEGVTAADSAIGRIDGAVGELRYCGYLAGDLAKHSDFEETTWLLWHNELPTQKQYDEFCKHLKSHRELSPRAMKLLGELASAMAPMDALRTMVSALAMDDIAGATDDRDANLERAVRLTAQFPTIIAAYARLRAGKKVIAPDSKLGHAANFLYMLNGEKASDDMAHMFDVCLVLHAEHGFNASTFSARVTAATLSDIYSCMTSAIGTLKGPLHGGANTAVMNMLMDIGSLDAVESSLDSMLAEGKKVMGFGHRVYKVVDPRALILKEFAGKLAKQSDEPKWYEMSSALEKLMKERKGIDMNVDFYSASTYFYMGIEPDMYTTIFALSRISGWIAHVLEQYANNRLIRPRANWIGKGDLEYVARDKR